MCRHMLPEKLVSRKVVGLALGLWCLILCSLAQCDDEQGDAVTANAFHTLFFVCVNSKIQRMNETLKILHK